MIIVLLVAFFATQIDGYLSGTTFTRISASFAIVAVLAVGQTLVVLTRNVDLSVGSIVGLIAYGVGTLLGSFQDLPPVLVIGLCLVLGGVLGAINGVIVSWGRVPAIVTTLGTLAIFRVLLVELSGSKTVTTESLPAWVVDLPRVDLVTIGTLDIRPLVVIALAVAVVFQLGLRYLPFGRRLFAIGSNPEGAQLVGMPVKRDVFLAFTLSGALAGLAGFMFLSRFGNITVAAGLGLELQAVAAVVVGGVNIFGGIGSIGGAVLGAFLIDLLSQSLTRMEAVSEFTRDALLGLLILLAVASDSVILARLRAGWQSARAREMARREAEGPSLADLRRFLRSWEGLLLVVLIVIVVANAISVQGYLQPQNQVNLLTLGIEKAIVALVMAFVIIGGEIDLSVASIMGLAAILFAWAIDQGVAPEVALLLALGVGLLCGLNNAFWVAVVGLPSLAVTLAGLIGYRGLALMLIEDGSLGGFPDWFEALGQRPFIGPIRSRCCSSSSC